jgi:nucleolar GTP-binding protein
MLLTSLFTTLSLASAAAAGAITRAENNKTCTNPEVRKEWRELTDAEKAEYIREKHRLIRNEAKMRKSLKNRAIIPRSKQKKSFAQLEDHLDQLGVDTEDIGLRGRKDTQTRGRSVTRSRVGTEDPDSMDVDITPHDRLRSKSRARSQPATNRRDDGVQDEGMRTKAERVAKLGQRHRNRMAKAGEADRHIGATMPKHLFAGKRTIGKTSRR